jgi:1-deoxy-D-xylulose-5-phosphate reductoisomerase
VQLALYAEAQRRGYPTGKYTLPRLLVGPDAATQAAAVAADVVLNGITGAAGLMPTLAALRAGSTLALANKESLIIGGDVVTRVAAPVRSCPSTPSTPLWRRRCAASGGGRRQAGAHRQRWPFRGRTRAELADVSVEEALAHPTWRMGPVITINSATLLNKGLEVIEAHLLFDVPFDRIDVVVHPPSIVHSMVEFVDGATIVQASPPSMKIPIAVALAWPGRVPGAAPACDWTGTVSWPFEPLDDEAFPAIRLARRAGAAGGTAPAVLNAANEVCVEAFREGALPFLAIMDTVGTVLEEHLASSAGIEPVPSGRGTVTVADVLGADAQARERARTLAEAAAS